MGAKGHVKGKGSRLKAVVDNQLIVELNAQ